MPSIFIWKAKQPISTTTIQYYSGMNWFLEEHSSYSKSAVYLHQQSLSNEGWMFDIKWMPNNWVGSHLLEHKSLPYSLIKKDNYAQLEQLGDWMRATIMHDVPHESRELEWATIQKWATIPQSSTIHKAHSNYQVVPDEPCLINLSFGSYTNTGQSHHKSYGHHREPFYQKIK